MAQNFDKSPVLYLKQVPFTIEHTIKDDFLSSHYNGTTTAFSQSKEIENTSFSFQMQISKCMRSDYLCIKLRCVSFPLHKVTVKNYTLEVMSDDRRFCKRKIYNLSEALSKKFDTMVISDSIFNKRNPLNYVISGHVYNGEVIFRISGFLLFQDTRTESLPKDLENIFNEEETSDVTLTVGERKFYAHRCILIARSPVFKAMLESQMKEDIENSVTIEETDPDVFEAFLRFLYTDNIPSNVTNIVPNLLFLADKYIVDALKDLCETEMMNSINIENCSEYCVSSNLANAQNLYENALKFIKKNLNDVLKSEGWKKMGKNPNAIARLLDIIDKLAV